MPKIARTPTPDQVAKLAPFRAADLAAESHCDRRSAQVAQLGGPVSPVVLYALERAAEQLAQRRGANDATPAAGPVASESPHAA